MASCMLLPFNTHNNTNLKAMYFFATGTNQKFYSSHSLIKGYDDNGTVTHKVTPNDTNFEFVDDTKFYSYVNFIIHKQIHNVTIKYDIFYTQEQGTAFKNWTFSNEGEYKQF